MQLRLFRNALSVFMAFALVLTSNSATFQPLVAFADDGAPIESAALARSAEAGSQDVGGVDSANPPAAADGAEAGEIKDGAPVLGLGTRPSRNLTNDGDVLSIDLAGFAYADAGGFVQVVEPVGSRLDASGIDFDDVSNMELRYRVVLEPGDVAAGDMLDLTVPRDAFSIDGDRLIEANAGVAGRLVLEDRQDMLEAVVAASSVPADEPVVLDVRVPVVLAEGAQTAYAREVELALHGDRVATVVLPAAKAENEEEAVEEDVVAGDQVEVDLETPLLRSATSRSDDNPDKTNDLDQLLLGVAAFSYKDAQGVSHDIPNTGTDKKPVYDFSGVPFATIGDLYMEVDFQIVPDDEMREIKEGDYYRYALPSIFKVDPNTTPQALYSPLGQTIATYTIEKDADGKAYFKVVFTDTVNIDKGYVSIVGGVGATFRLDKDSLKNDGSTSESWKLQESGTEYVFVAPSTSSELKGIEKHGTYDKDGNTVSWTITVGSDPASAGLSLKGITVTDTFDKAQQTVQDVKGPDGVPLGVTDTDNGFSCTFPDDSTAVAPYQITVTTKVEKAVLDATVKGDQSVENGAKMESPKDSEVVVPPGQEATDSVTVPRFGFSKEGEPLNSSTIAWYLTVNEGGVCAATNVVVSDRLDARAGYIDGTLKINGSSVNVCDPDAAPSGGTYAVLTKGLADDEGAYSLLEIHFDGLVNTEQNIAFETSVAIEDNEANYQPIDFNNRAWIDYDWPSGEGPGDGTIPGLDINADFQVVYLDKETPSFNERTGVIDWTIAPSTRTENYTRGVITDVVGATEAGDRFDQELVTDASNPTGYAITVAHKDGTSLTDGELAAVFAYDPATHRMTFSFDHYNDDGRVKYSLNDLIIAYQSQALDFLRENWTDHTYRNTAHLEVMGDGATFEADDNAERTFKNEFLSKASDYSVVDSASESTGYLHYRITVNGSQMPNTALSLTDDLSALETSVVDSNGDEKTTVEASKWTIVNGDPADKSIRVTKRQGTVGSDVTSTFPVSDWANSKKIDFSVTGAEAASACFIIDLYLTLDKAELQRLYKDDQLVDGFRVLVKNTATADSDGYQGDGGAQVECVGSEDSPDISEQFAEKTVDGSHHKDGYLDYRIALNPNGLELKDAVATDSFDEALEIDLDSVQLYYAEHEGASIKDGHGDPVAASAWTKQLAYDAKDDKIVLRVGLPDGAASYVMEYRAKIIGSAPGGKVSNTVSVVMGDTPLGDDSVTADVDVDSWGWLTQMAIYKLVKVDAFSGETSPLKGVRFNLYSDKNMSTLVKAAVSNAQGLVSFYGLEPNTTYYFSEDPSSVDVSKYTTTSGRFTTGHKGTTIIQGQSNAVKNDRTKSDVSVELTKAYKELAGATYQGDRQSAFKLYLYPNGRGTNPKVPIAVAESATGSYAYDADGTAFELHDASTGDLNISGLPWGDYGIEEAATADGYTLYQGARYFSVVAPEVSGGTWTVSYAPTGSTQDATQKISNVPTELTVKKSTTGTSLQDAVLSIYRSNPDGSQSNDKVVSPFGGDELTTTIADDAKSFTWHLDGIPAGSYWLVEDEGPKDTALSMFDPVQFGIDAYGKVTKVSGSGTLSGTTLSVRDDVAQVKVQKLDQWGTGVAGATLELRKSDGAGAWSKVDEWTTGESDAASGYSFAGLDRGATYRVVETAVPSGYEQANHGTASQVSGEPQTIEFAIDEFGKAVDVKLYNGNAPSGGNGNFLNVDSGNNTFILRNERIVGHARFVKYDTTTDGSGAKKPLTGVEFDLYRMEGSIPDVSADTSVNASGKHFTSGSDGTVTTVGSTLTNGITGESMSHGLTPGAYYFVEVGTHNDFVFDVANPLKTEVFTIGETDNRFTWVAGSGFTDPATVTMADGDDVTNRPLNAQVKLVKKNADGTTALIGVTFELRDASGKVIDRQKTAAAGTTFANTVKAADSNGNTPTATSTEEGELIFVNIPHGTYKVVETEPAPGYRLDGAEYPVTVAWGTPNEVYELADDATVKNEQNHLAIEKIGVEGHTVAGTAFELTPVDGATFANNTGGKLSWTVAADLSNNPFDITGELVAGSVYKLVETKPAFGYTLASDVYLRMDKLGNLSTSASARGEFTPVADNKLQVTNALNEVSFKKVDQFDRPVEGAAFELKGTFADGTELHTWKTSDQQVLTLTGDLVAGGEYTLREITVPDGYLATSDQVVRVTTAGELQQRSGDAEPYTWTNIADDQLVVSNKLALAHAKLIKADESGNAFTGATFSLYKQGASAEEEDLLILAGITPAGTGATWTTADAANTMTNPDTGLALKEGLANGTYYFVETATANDRYLDTTHHEFTLGIGDDGKTVQKTVVNVKMNAAMTLIKVDATSESPLPGVAFELSCAPADGSTMNSQTLTTDGHGVITARNLVKGDYTLKETGTDANYANGGFAATFTVTDACQDNTLAIGADAMGAATPFNLVVTNDAGNLRATSLANKRVLGTVNIEKLGADGALPGVTFEVRTADDATVENGVTDGSGKVSFADLAWGDYYVVETAVPDGYVLDTTKHEFAIGYGALVKNYTVADGSAIANTQTAYTLSKFHGDSTAGLAGATFEIAGTFADGTTAPRSLLSGAQSQTETGVLVGGNTYTVTETVPPVGYQVRPAFGVTMGKDGTLALVGTPEGVSLEGNTIKVADLPNKATIAKVNADGSASVAGAQFKLSGTFADGSGERTWSSAATSEELAGKLVADREYTLVETKPAAGYVISSWKDSYADAAGDGSSLTVKMDAFGQLSYKTDAGTWESLARNEVVMKDALNTLTLAKKDISGAALADAVFTIEGTIANADGSVTQQTIPLLNTPENRTQGEATLSGRLVAGETYTVKETVPPDGFAAVPDFQITMNADGSITPVGTLPSGVSIDAQAAGIVVKDAPTSLAIAKQDVAGKNLAGAGFTLTGRFADGSTQLSWTSLADVPTEGAGLFTGRLIAGEEYVLSETVPPQGCKLSVDLPLTLRVTSVGQVQQKSGDDWQDVAGAVATDPFVVANEPNELTLHKVDEKGIALDGARFTVTGIFANGTSEETRELPVSTTGGTMTGALVAGSAYVVSEVLPPAGFRTAPDFSVLMQADGTVVAAGELPEGIILDGNAFTVSDEQTELSFNKEGLFVESCSDPLLGAVAPDAALPLAGVEFTAYTDEGCTTVAQTVAGDAVVASSENGRVTFRGLAGGATYYVKESKALAGHVLPDTVYQAVFATDGTLTSFTQLGSTDAVATIVKDVFRTDISIKKVSETDPSKALPGSTYGLYKRASAPDVPAALGLRAAAFSLASPAAALGGELQLVAKATTDEDGVLMFKGVLMNQEYVIQELAAPDGSLVSKHPITMTFEVDENGATKLVKFDDGSGTAYVDENGNIVWREPQVVVEFSKKDVEGRLLAGAKLQVVDASGIIVCEPWTSSYKAPHRIEGVLTAGAKYRLVEVEAPVGYERAADVEFTVQNPKLGPREGFVQQVDMVDEREATPPAKTSAAGKPFGFLTRTGDAPLVFVVAGVAFAAAGVAAATGVRRRRKHR